MNRYSEKHMRKIVAELIFSGQMDFETDDDSGEILFATKLYQNKNGGIQDQPDSEWRPELGEEEDDG